MSGAEAVCTCGYDGNPGTVRGVNQRGKYCREHSHSCSHPRASSASPTCTYPPLLPLPPPWARRSGTQGSVTVTWSEDGLCVLGFSWMPRWGMCVSGVSWTSDKAHGTECRMRRSLACKTHPLLRVSSAVFAFTIMHRKRAESRHQLCFCNTK